ncbi:MAG TPA: HAD family phosphatase [Cyanobacteria bacterium UBA11149]|nr:HAD family phosphatase [Cyanobacteria bacterium UBA11367]HBE57770.1 HAD family phosphatase [Cyanobacteria bacterium UBA11366]HBK62984.1 HAD family phosphatase [Cyanobacteria bacterium UBA11166]HBR77259.1 HAD family phosphatase [Cyanobacteria bacterium UBA11159]HBS69371.1 HAD family phosphatase [Cyanobacteria bacterium UBA11153]HBW90108.1 HAD family phosphatase [Cyanobacteria bacterium UBA11149]HCA94978.1 HAD family phosphatase [Cyanobacteria bacterium UBA9226]
MTLKAVLFDFNGVIINDEGIHKQLIEEILLQENLRPSADDYREYCLGKSDRVCLIDLLKSRGRFVSDSTLNSMIARKAELYRQKLEELPKLPIYPGLEDLIFKIRLAELPMGVVSGALRSEVELVLSRVELLPYFSVIVAGDDIKVSKPEPDGYLLAVERLNQQYPDLKASSNDCLAIEDTFAGIEAAKRAGMQVVGVANTYPFHMIQRQANWAVDYLNDLELERVQEVYATTVDS